MAESKVELLRMSLGERLSEIPKTSTFSKIDILREELNRTSTSVQTRDSVVAKMAALSGKLNMRFVGARLLVICTIKVNVVPYCVLVM